MKSFSSCVLSTKVGHNFGCHMTPAEFYVSSDALVHLQVSTEYLIARAVEQLTGCLAQQEKVTVEVKVQQTGNAGAKG